MEEIDGVKLVKDLAVKMEEMFRRKAEATRVSTVCFKNNFLYSCIFSSNLKGGKGRASEKGEGLKGKG